MPIMLDTTTWTLPADVAIPLAHTPNEPDANLDDDDLEGAFDDFDDDDDLEDDGDDDDWEDQFEDDDEDFEDE